VHTFNTPPTRQRGWEAVLSFADHPHGAGFLALEAAKTRIMFKLRQHSDHVPFLFSLALAYHEQQSVASVENPERLC
jgi:hypothetical protein